MSDEIATGSAEGVWCVVANIKRDHPHGPGGEETKIGTRQFRGGTKVYIAGCFAGTCDGVIAIGLHRRSRRFITCVVNVKHLENFRAKLVAEVVMLLRMVDIEASRAAGGVEVLKKLADDYGLRLGQVGGIPVFRWTIHHIKEIFLALLPKEFVLDGSSKVTVICGPRTNEPEFRNVLGCSVFLDETFDFLEYLRMNPLERQERVLTVLQNALLAIVERDKRDVEAKRLVVLRTAELVREHQFSLKILSKKLSRSSPCRSLRLAIFRNLNRIDGESWSCEIVDIKTRIVHSEWIGKRPDYLDRTDIYKKSGWEGSCFFLKDRFGRTEYSLNISPFLT